MGRDATKAAGNPWYQARKKAAEYDDRLCSRESAAEQLGMSVSSLADAELGNTKFMPVDKAVLMADRYNAPWLLNHYCLNECPIGCRHSLSDEVVGIDRVTVKLLKSLKTEKLGDVKDTLLDIAADGKITEDEKPALQEVLAYPDIGAPNWEIIVAAAAEQIAGAGLILWTCRDGELLENALEACTRWGLHFDAVNDSLPSWKKFYGNDTRKVGATEYWDDKAYRVQNGKLMKEVAHEMD